MTQSVSSPTEICILGRSIGPASASFIIAEISQSHDGSLGTAHAYIDAVANAGADAIKFQTHIAHAESTLDEAFRVKFSKQDATRYDYWKRMEFSKEQWRGLAEHAREKGLIFLSSAFSLEAVELLQEIGMPAWKVGSGEFRSQPLMEAMAVTGAPILYSTGMSSYSEIDAAVSWFKRCNLHFALFQCTSKYPVSLQQVGINVLEDFRRRYACPTGLSDHSGSIFPGLAALALGANLLEVHVVFDKRLFGPDVSVSLLIEELQLLCRARDAFYIMHTHPVDKDKMSDDLLDMRTLFTKSMALSRDLPAGTVLTASVLVGKKPGTGIPYSEMQKLLGRRLSRDVSAKHLLSWEDLTNDEPICSS